MSHQTFKSSGALALSLLLTIMLIAACQSAQPSQPAQPTSALPAGGNAVPPLQGSGTSNLGASLSHVEGTPGRTLNLKGNFAYVANDGNLSLQNASTGETRVLVKTSTEGYAQSPSFSPDGKQVAYSYNSFTKDGFVKSQIRVINLDGSNERVLAAPDDMKITLDFPTWSPDGKYLYVTQAYPVPPSDQHTEIDRLDVNGGGALTPLIDGGYEAHLSPDGKKIVYQRVDFKTFTAGLWISDIDGSNAKQIMPNGAFSAIFGAHFSPQADKIIFAGSGPPKLKLPGVQGYLSDKPKALLSPSSDDACFVQIMSICVVQVAYAHGLPWDLWLVDPAGTKFERLTEIGADSPVPVWSADGNTVAFFEATGIYLLDLNKKAIYAVSGNGGYGGFDWR